MLSELWRLLEGRSVTPAAPPDFTPILPEADEPNLPETDFEPELESVAGVGCIITYSNTKGQESVRRITCRKLSAFHDATYLQAWCHERKMLRTFRLDRIIETVCGATGEVFIPGKDFFAPFMTTHDGGSAASFGLAVRLAADLRAGLNVLAFLAKADGRIVPEERQVMRTFCQAFAVRFADNDFDFDGVCEHSQRLAPDAETFAVSLERLTRTNAPNGLRSLVKQYAGDLIEVDGEQHPKEFYFGMKVKEVLDA